MPSRQALDSPCRHGPSAPGPGRVQGCGRLVSARDRQDARRSQRHIYLGGVLARSGRLKEAETAHRAAIRCTQGCRDKAYLNLGLVLRAQERYEEAATCFEQALKLDPKYVAARKALRDVRDTMRFSKEKRREEAAKPALEPGTAESRSAGVETEPVAS